MKITAFERRARTQPERDEIDTWLQSAGYDHTEVLSVGANADGTTAVTVAARNDQGHFYRDDATGDVAQRVEQGPPVLAADTYATNGHLIAAVAQLGYLTLEDHVLDPTYERGIWWQEWRPRQLTTHHRAVDGSDFRNLPYPDATFDAIAFDPPYVCPGGRKTSTVKPMHDRYGMNEGGHEDPMFSTPAELQQIINDGLTEMVRLVKPRQTKNRGGIILVKCQNYIWSGALWEGAELTRDHARALGCDVVDRLEYLTKPGPQPTVNPDGSPRRQVHARRNLSTLFVFRAPARAAVQPDLFQETP